MARRVSAAGPASLSAALAAGSADDAAGDGHGWPARRRDVYAAALLEGLGPDYADRIALPTFPGPDAALGPAPPGSLRMARIRRRFALDADLAYGEFGSANYLDIWRRPDLDPRDGKAPVLFQIPGGAWTTGNKRGQAHPLMSHLVELGWICVASTTP